MVLVARDVRGPWPGHVQRDTTSDGMLAFGHSRSGITRPSQLSRQSSRPVSGRPRVRIVAEGTTHVVFVQTVEDTGLSIRERGFESRTRHQFRNPRRAHASGVEIGRNDWAAPEPVTGWIRWGCSSTRGRAAALQAAGCRFDPCHLHQHRLVNSVARVPACLAGSRGFDSRTRRQISLPR